MNKKITLIPFIFIFVFSLFSALPFAADAQGSYYVFRSTVMGAGVKQTGQYVYEINNEKINFNANESVFFLTRIFNISNVDRFQFKHEIRSSSYTKDVFSPMYYPRRNWWAEIYYWDKLESLPAGNYEINSYVSIDGGYYAHHRTTNFTVHAPYAPPSGYYYGAPVQPLFQPTQSYPYYYVQARNYSYNWTHIGKNIRKTGAHSYEIVNQTTDFRSNEDVYALTKISNVSGIDSFRVKYDIYLNGNRYHKSNEVPTLWPRGNQWESNYSWGNLGKLPAGYHEIRTFLSINGGAYTKLNSQQISVDRYADRYADRRIDYYGPEHWRHRDEHRRRYHRPEKIEVSYKYDWTRVNTYITHVGGYQYDTADKRDYWKDENIKVLTKISDIKNIDTFRVKHKLYRGNAFIKQIISSERHPNNRYWHYNYAQSDFGKQSAGSYTVKTYIRVNKEAYKFLGSKNFTVKARRVSSDYRYKPRHDFYYGYPYASRYNYDRGGYYDCQHQHYYHHSR
ncbi:hypothetical protein KAU09_03930 [Candidatus Parcubacteria bacterium]|nr:hypothetical protein [Candidatus Parcubacteria bacterium]